MRLLFVISVYFLSCLNLQAAQYTSTGKPLSLSVAINSSPAASSFPPCAFETYLTPYDNAEGRLLRFLDQAKNRCYIASYSITNSNVVAKLVELHKHGVDVQILTDKTQAAGKREQEIIAILQANNIPVFIGKSVNHALMHCKFCVIDDHLVEDGSWNFTTSANREDNILNFADSKERAKEFLAYWFKIKADMQY